MKVTFVGVSAGGYVTIVRGTGELRPLQAHFASHARAEYSGVTLCVNNGRLAEPAALSDAGCGTNRTGDSVGQQLRRLPVDLQVETQSCKTLSTKQSTYQNTHTHTHTYPHTRYPTSHTLVTRLMHSFWLQTLYEQRTYPAQKWVCSRKIVNTADSGSDGIFMRLFGYITGTNKEGKHLPFIPGCDPCVPS